MFALDLFSSKHEQDLHEGAVDNLEARRIDDLNERMQDLLARARNANPEMKAALKREFDKIKAERDSYFKIREGGIPGNIPTEKIPGKEDLLKGKGRSYYEEGGIPGNVPTEKIPGKEDLLKGKGRSYYESNQKKNSEEVTEEQKKFAYKVVCDGYDKGNFVNKNDAIYSGQYMIYYGEKEYTSIKVIELKTGDVIWEWHGTKDDNDVAPTEIEVDEGYQDFNKVEPYAVCLAGKPVKEFDYYEDARRFHDNWKKKLYNQGEQAKADKITLMPITKESATAPIIVPKRKAKEKQPTKFHIPYTADDYVPPAVALARDEEAKKKEVKEDQSSWIVYDPETKQIKKRFKTHTAGKSYAKAHGLGFASSEYYFDNVKQPVNEFAPSPERDDNDDVPDQIVKLANRWWNAAGDQPKIESVLRSLGWSIHQVESEDDAVQLQHNDGTTYFISADDFDPEVFEVATDYSKRRQREKDIDAGRPVPKQRQPKMTDYQKRRAQQKKEMELGEDDPMGGATIAIGQPDGAPADLEENQDTSGVERAILHRIMVANTDLLMKFGPDKVMQAAEEVAYNVGDVDEIGSSDISAYVHQVRQILGA